ncbi:MAG: arginine repressor [Lachnospiraceae bacterium]|nr:arginine repressor [Lachnospiraceae bacterium]
MKKSRQTRIVELIGMHEIETQEELVERLRGEGYDVTQATVSRDIRELKLSKVPSETEKGKQKYIVTHRVSQMSDKYIRVLREGLISMDMAQNILVAKTVSGMAMAVAAAVDGLNMPEVVGTIAGDDTIMMAIRTTEDTVTVMQKINKMIDG